MEVHEEVDDDEVPCHERREDKNHDSRKNESPTQLQTEFASALCLQRLMVDLAALVKNKVENAESEDPLHGTGEELAIAQQGQRNRKVQNVLVDQSNQVVLAPHETIGNV